MLQKMKIKERNLCKASQVKHYTEHFLKDCNFLKGFWSVISSNVLIEMDTHVASTKKVIFGVTKQVFESVSSSCLKLIDYILLIGKNLYQQILLWQDKNHIKLHFFSYEWRLRRNQIPGSMQFKREGLDLILTNEYE